MGKPLLKAPPSRILLKFLQLLLGVRDIKNTHEKFHFSQIRCFAMVAKVGACRPK